MSLFTVYIPTTVEVFIQGQEFYFVISATGAAFSTKSVLTISRKISK